jgi:hypothetical protein
VIGWDYDVCPPLTDDHIFDYLNVVDHNGSRGHPVRAAPDPCEDAHRAVNRDVLQSSRDQIVLSLLQAMLQNQLFFARCHWDDPMRQWKHLGA